MSPDRPTRLSQTPLLLYAPWKHAETLERVNIPAGLEEAFKGLQGSLPYSIPAFCAAVLTHDEQTLFNLPYGCEPVWQELGVPVNLALIPEKPSAVAQNLIHGLLLPFLALDVVFYVLDPNSTPPPSIPRQPARPIAMIETFRDASLWLPVLLASISFIKQTAPRVPRKKDPLPLAEWKQSFLEVARGARPLSRILNNVNQAAVALRWFLMGFTTVEEGSLRLYAHQDAKNRGLKPSDEDIEMIAQATHRRNFLKPLYVALVTSPLLLLNSTLTWSGKHVPRAQELNNHWRAMGTATRENCYVGELERALWTSLLRIAVYAQDAKTAVTDFIAVYDSQGEPSDEDLFTLLFQGDIMAAEQQKKLQANIRTLLQNPAEMDNLIQMDGTFEETMRDRFLPTFTSPPKPKETRQKRVAQTEQADVDPAGDKVYQTRSKDPAAANATSAKAAAADSAPQAKTARRRKPPKSAEFVNDDDDDEQEEPDEEELDELKDEEPLGNSHVSPAPRWIPSAAEFVDTCALDLFSVDLRATEPAAPVKFEWCLRAPTSQALEEQVLFITQLTANLRLDANHMPLFLGDTARIPDPTLVPGPTVSLLHVTTPEDFLALPYKTQQEMFRHRCILFDQVKVTDGPPVSFDVQGLRQYREIGSEVDIQDSFAREENQVHRVFKTPLSTLLDPDRQGLNALSIDISGRTIPAPPAYRSLATHEPAILGVPGHSAGELPSGPLRWAQFSKKHSFTFQHVDVAATYFQCLVGPKIFFLGIQGPVLYPGRGDWSSRRMFSAWNPLEANTEVFATEMICLRPDQILYMQPQTPHAVITIDNSVAIGGHLITSATIQRAVCGTLINAMNQDAAINVRDSVTRFLLLRVFSLQVGRILDGQGDSEHVPDLTTADGVLDLLFLHHLVAVYLAVDPSSYKNPDPEFPMTRARLREVSYIRSLSKPLVQYIDSNFVFESTQPTLSSFLDATALSLRHMALCLLVFKCEQGASKNFTADALRDRLVKDLTSFADLHAHPDLPRPTDGLVKAFREKAAQEHDTESAFVHFMPWDAQTLPFTLTRREQLKRRNESPSNGRKRARRSNE